MFTYEEPLCLRSRESESLQQLLRSTRLPAGERGGPGWCCRRSGGDFAPRPEADGNKSPAHPALGGKVVKGRPAPCPATPNAPAGRVGRPPEPGWRSSHEVIHRRTPGLNQIQPEDVFSLCFKSKPKQLILEEFGYRGLD